MLLYIGVELLLIHHIFDALNLFWLQTIADADRTCHLRIPNPVTQRVLHKCVEDKQGLFGAL